MRTREEDVTIAGYNQFPEQWVDKNRDTTVFDREFPKIQSLLPQGKFLEIGSAGGRDAVKIAAAGYDYAGIDVSTGLIEVARNRFPDLKFYNQSIYGISFPENEFDGFWCAATLLHLPKMRIYEALGNIYRVLKPNGVGFFCIKKGTGDMVREEEFVDDKPFVRYFSYYQPDEFSKVLTKARFTILEHSEVPVSRKTTWLNFIVQK